jgi:hypothetical protein
VSTEPRAPFGLGLPEDQRESHEPAHEEDETDESEESLDIRRLLRQVTRSQTRALILDHYASKLIADFAAHGEERPRMLLQLPDRGSFPADIDDVLELQNDLILLADQSRARSRQLLRARASIPAEPAGRRPAASLPSEPGEQVVDASIRGPKKKSEPGDDWRVLDRDVTPRPRGTPAKEQTKPSGRAVTASRRPGATAAAPPAVSTVTSGSGSSPRAARG